MGQVATSWANSCVNWREAHFQWASLRGRVFSQPTGGVENS